MKYAKAGQPKRFKSPAIFKKKVIEYLDHCTETGEIPFIVGFSVYTRIPKDTIEGYKHYEGYGEFYELIKNASENTLLQGSLKKMFSDKMAMMCLRNHYGYSGETQTTPTEAINQTSSTIEIIAALPPKQDE